MTRQGELTEKNWAGRTEPVTPRVHGVCVCVGGWMGGLLAEHMQAQGLQQGISEAAGPAVTSDRACSL